MHSIHQLGLVVAIPLMRLMPTDLLCLLKMSQLQPVGQLLSHMLAQSLVIQMIGGQLTSLKDLPKLNQLSCF
jgi:hypothetical protein